MENKEIAGGLGGAISIEMQLDVLLKDRGVPVYDVLSGVEEKRRGWGG